MLVGMARKFSTVSREFWEATSLEATRRWLFCFQGQRLGLDSGVASGWTPKSRRSPANTLLDASSAIVGHEILRSAAVRDGDYRRMWKLAPELLRSAPLLRLPAPGTGCHEPG